jgi:hypothetical protein
MVVEQRSVPTRFRQSKLEASLTDLIQWTSVFGERANASAAATAGFKQAMANLGTAGFSFGGDCFYGHGVRVSGGSARFAVISYAIELGPRLSPIAWPPLI